MATLAAAKALVNKNANQWRN